MKMKKIISLVLVVTMVLSMSLMMTSCGGNGSDGGDKITVALIVADGFGDRSFYDSSKEGLDKLESEGLVNAMTIECNGENFEQQMRNAADEADVVIPVGWQFDSIATVAKDYPDKKFIWIDNTTDKTLDNLQCITYAQNEGSFLAGYVAAKMSKSGVVGAVGGMDMPTINDFLVGYKQGAKYANKDIKVVTNYVGSFEDPAQGKECATALNSKGADVIFQVAGNSGSGVIESAEENGYYAIGVDGDQKYIAEDTVICSMIKNTGKSIYTVIKDYVDNGTWEGNRTWVADMATGFIELGYGEKDAPQQISDDLKAEVQGVAQDIIDGKIVVDTVRD